jgi:hypothetical protein
MNLSAAVAMYRPEINGWIVMTVGLHRTSVGPFTQQGAESFRDRMNEDRRGEPLILGPELWVRYR